MTKSNTNTKTKPTAAELSHQRFDKAKAALAKHTDDLAVVEGQIAAVESAWNKGDDSIEAEVMIKLDAERDRLVRLVKGAENEHKAASRSLKTDDPDIADAIAYALGDTFYGVKIECVTELPQGVAQGDRTVPRVLIVQSKASTRVGDIPNPYGSVAIRGTEDLYGDVTMHIFGPEWVRAFIPAQVFPKLEAGGVYFPRSVSRIRDERGNRSETNIIDLREVAVPPRFPACRRFEKGQEFSGIIFHLIASGASVYGVSGRVIRTEPLSARVVDVADNGDGTQTATIEERFSVLPVEGVKVNDVRDVAARSVPRIVRKTTRGGRIVAAEVIDRVAHDTGVKTSHGANVELPTVTVRFEAKSRIAA